MGFAATRVIYRLVGVRFDGARLGTTLQFIDPQLLREDLVSSLWHLHYQPPLYNLYLGLVLKASGDDGTTIFHATYLLAGLALALALYALMCRLGVRAGWSAAIALGFAASPAIVLYENWLYVEYLVAAALTLSAVLLHRFAAGAGAGNAVAAFWLLGGIVLSRTLFHLVWLVGIAGIVVLLLPGRRREVLLAAIVPVALCAAVYGKNLVQQGSFSASTCTGVNLYDISTNELSPSERAHLVARGELSRFALLNPNFLPRRLVRGGRPTGVRLLDEPVKSTGAPNLNATGYKGPCRRYAADARTVIRRHPRAYATGVANAVLIFLRPSSDYKYLDRDNVREVKGPERVMAAAVMGQFERTPVTLDLEKNLRAIGWFILLGYGAAVAIAVGTLATARRGRTWDAPAALVAALFLATFAWVTLAGTLFDVGENNRFRFPVDPLALAVLAGGVARHLSRRAGAHGSVAAAPDGPSVRPPADVGP
ncbi:MAG: hypothetical protein QOE65_701 [Solirubrobacteraceae bacterium]|jgi:hypothetical protein|nr:hypothetical protein [Solirubrobacteraceae bacterium]